MKAGIIRTDIEVHDCHGCGGEVPVGDECWLPEKPGNPAPDAKPYCCRECAARNGTAPGAGEGRSEEVQA